CAVHDRGVNLIVQREAVGVGADLGARAAAVLVHPLDLVSRLSTEIQRRVGPVADAAEPRREHDLVRTRSRPAQERHSSSHPRAFSRSRALWFWLGSSTTQSSSSDRTRPSSGPSRYPSASRSEPST